MKKYLIFLLTFSVFGQTTQINDLHLTGVWQNNQGGIHIEWFADPGEDTTVHGANEYWFIQWSQDENFIDAGHIYFSCWENGDTLKLEHDLEPVGNGTWFIRIAFGWGINSLHDVTTHGSNSGWTPYASLTVNNSYNIPVFFPPASPYTSQELLVRFADSENIQDYDLHISQTREFHDYDSYSILLSDNGYRYINLEEYGEGFIYFRFRGTTTLGATTEWTFSEIWYEPGRLYYYYLPWVTPECWVNFNILNDMQMTDIRIGVLPEKTGTFQPSIWYQSLTAYNSSIWLERVNDLFPFSLQGRPMIFESTEPISVNVYYDVSIGSIPVQTPFLLPEGTADEWLLPSIRKDDYHLPAVVISNASETGNAVVDWRLDYKIGNDYYYETGGVSIDPFDNIVIDLDVPGDWVGYVTVTNRTGSEISVLYSNRNILDDLVIYGFQMALQK